MLYGVASKKRSKLTAFQSLFLLDIELYYKAERGLQKLKEYKLNPPLSNIACDIRKSTLAMFLAELVSKTVKEEYADKMLFDFIKVSILFLEEIEYNIAIFHLVFLIKLSRFLGFAPETSSLINAKFYDYKNGVHVNTKPYHNYYMDDADFQSCVVLMDISYSNLDDINMTIKQRDRILNILLDLYDIHILNFKSLKSYAVLKEVFS
jgi:DNA repair protein RecO (recombination protein O)